MNVQNQTENLVNRARGGDRAALDELVAMHQHRLERWIRSRLGGGIGRKLSVGDIVQETLMKAVKALDRFDWQGEDSFLRWMNRIALNVIREAARREHRKLIVPLDEDVAAQAPTQSADLRRRERFGRLETALDTLSPDHRRVIVLARLKRLPMKEVACRMGRSPEAATQLLWRAMKNLKASFGDTESLNLPNWNLERRGDDHEE